MTLSDEANAELDSRKITEVVHSGTMSIEEILDAEIVLECPHCHLIQNYTNDTCMNCMRDIS